MQTEKDKMLAGELYDPLDPELVRSRERARDLCHDLNAARENGQETRRRILIELFGQGGDSVWMQPPFFCDYGSNILLGERVFFNFNCVVLDVCHVKIGDFTMFGPAVQIYTAAHPMNAELRRKQEFGQPIEIGSDVWVGGGAIICPGVRIGSKAVIGAGSVVTRDIRGSRRGAAVIGAYMRSVKQAGCQPLTRSEEVDLGARSLAGDVDARNTIVRSCLPLVAREARKFLGMGMDLDDLVQNGNLGLVRAAQKFDPAVGTRLSTYATYWIRAAILRALNSNALVRVPEHAMTLMHRMERSGVRVTGEAKSDATAIAAAMECTAGEAVSAILAERARTPPFPLRSSLAGYRIDPAAGVAGRERLSALSRMLLRLPSQQRRILGWLLDGDSRAQIPERLGVTETRVGQIVRAATEILRRHRDELAGLV